MTDFAETVLDMGFDYGAIGGPQFSTTVVATAAGYESRNRNWAEARGSWDLGERNIVEERKDYLLNFFRAMGGSHVAFRFKDWTDYRATDEVLVLDGSPRVQLIKSYTEGGETDVRTISKPRDGTVALKLNGGAYGYAALDPATGLVTMIPATSVAIASISAAANAVVVTAGAHGLTNGDVVSLANVTGAYSVLNGVPYPVTVSNSTTMSLSGADTSALGVHNGSGQVETYPQGSDVLTWSGEFEVPARFNTDQVRVEFLAFDDERKVGIYRIGSLPLVEVRT